MITRELIKVINLRDRHEDLAFYHDGEKGEIVHSWMVPDGFDDVDWDFEIVSVEEANTLLEKYGVGSQKIYG